MMQATEGMNLKKIEHIGIAVKDMKASIALFSSLFNAQPYKTEEVANEKVLTSFFKTGESKIELLQGSSPDSVITKFVEKRGEGIHHIAFEVDDIHAEINRLKAAGFIFINDEPKPGADNKLVCFLSPKSSNGVLIELCEEMKAGK